MAQENLKRCCESEQIIRKHPSGSAGAANFHAHDHSVCAQCTRTYFLET